MLLQMVGFPSFSWLKNIPLCVLRGCMKSLKNMFGRDSQKSQKKFTIITQKFIINSRNCITTHIFISLILIQIVFKCVYNRKHPLKYFHHKSDKKKILSLLVKAPRVFPLRKSEKMAGIIWSIFRMSVQVLVKTIETFKHGPLISSDNEMLASFVICPATLL